MHYILDGPIVISTNLLLDSKDGHNGYIEIKTCVPILVTKRSTLDKKLLSCNILTIKELQQDRRYRNNLRDVCSFFGHIKDKHIYVTSMRVYWKDFECICKPPLNLVFQISKGSQVKILTRSATWEHWKMI